MKIYNKSFVRFACSSIFNTLIGFGIIFFFQETIKLNPYLSNFLGYFAGYATSYIINRSWTFEYRGDTTKTAWLFILVSINAFVFNYIVLNLLLLNNINVLIAQSVAILVHGVIHYFGMRFFVFNKQTRV